MQKRQYLLPTGYVDIVCSYVKRETQVLQGIKADVRVFSSCYIN